MEGQRTNSRSGASPRRRGIGQVPTGAKGGPVESLADILKRVRFASSSTAVADDAEHANDCPNCGGYGWIARDVTVEHPDFGRAIPCTCRAAQHAQRQGTSPAAVLQHPRGHAQRHDLCRMEPCGLRRERRAAPDTRVHYERAYADKAAG